MNVLGAGAVTGLETYIFGSSYVLAASSGHGCSGEVGELVGNDFAGEFEIELEMES